MAPWSLPKAGTIVELGSLDNRAGIIKESTDSIRATGYIRKEIFYLQEFGWKDISDNSAQTSQELDMFRKNVEVIAGVIMTKENPIIFELGPGYSGKVRIILDYLEKKGKKCACALVDLNVETLYSEVPKCKKYKHINVFGVHGSFDVALQFARDRPSDMDGVVMSAGSVLANFEWSEAKGNLAAWGKGWNACELLIGQDAFDNEERAYGAYHNPQYRRFIEGGLSMMSEGRVESESWSIDHAASKSESRHYFKVNILKAVKLAGVEIPAGKSLEAFSSFKWTPEQMETMAEEIQLEVKDTWITGTMHLYHIAPDYDDPFENDSLAGKHMSLLAGKCSPYVSPATLLNPGSLHTLSADSHAAQNAQFLSWINHVNYLNGQPLVSALTAKEANWMKESPPQFKPLKLENKKAFELTRNMVLGFFARAPDLGDEWDPIDMLKGYHGAEFWAAAHGLFGFLLNHKKLWPPPGVWKGLGAAMRALHDEK